MIVLDLEWNSGRKNSGFDEILQIGAVRIEALGAPVVDTFNIYVKPQVHRTLHPAAAALPELTRSFTEGVRFPAAYRLFRQWAGRECDYAAWGTVDFHVLAQNAAHWKLPPLHIRTALDLQRGFGQRLGTNAQIALYRAVSYCQIPESFTYHNGLHDAMYAVLLTKFMTLEDLVMPPRAAGFRRCWRWTDVLFAAPPRKRSPYLPSISAVLNHPQIRQQRCPICGRKLWVQTWFLWQNEHYYAPLLCEKHGGFLCRLTLTKLSGQYRGCSAIIPADRRELLYFHAACGNAAICCQKYRKVCAQFEAPLQ